MNPDSDRMRKVCGSCGKEYNEDADILRHGTRFRICDQGNLWFNCSCETTLVIPQGTYSQFISPLHGLSQDAHSLFSVLSELKDLPCLPKRDLELYALVSSGRATEHEVMDAARNAPLVIGTFLDPAGSIRSATRGGPLLTLQQVINAIGPKIAAELILASSIRFFKVGDTLLDLGDFWREAQLTASIAESIVLQFLHHNEIDAVHAFIAGYFANIGKLVMALALPDLADQIVQETRNPAELKPWAEVEKSLNVVATHSLLGEIGSSIWGLPGYVSDVISRHHNLSSSDAITLVDVVALANQLSHWLALEPSRVMQQELVAVSGKFGLDSDRVRSAFVEQLFGERHIRKLLAKTR